MRIFVLILLFVLCGCDTQTSSLTIVHTNDLHAHLLPSDTKLRDCKFGDKNCFGGYNRIKTVIDNMRQSFNNVIVLDAGDRFSGSLFYTLNKSQDITALTQQLGYDVLTLGNHEFDDGVDELLKFVEGISAPIISTNVSFSEDTKLDKWIIPSVVLNRDGLKIGIVGALNEETRLESNLLKDVTISSVIPSVQAEVRKLIKQGVKVLIALTHIGIEEDKKLAMAVPELDIIVGGHTHTLLSNDRSKTDAYGPYPIVVSHDKGKKTLIVTSGIAGHYVGMLNVTFDKKGRVVSYMGDAIHMDDTIVSDEKMTKAINEAQQSIDEIVNKPIINISQNIHLTNNGTFCSESCYIGEFLTDMLRYSVDDVDIVLINSGGIRNDLPAGQVSLKDILSAYPFDSQGVLVKMTGDELKAYLEHGVKKYLPNHRTNAFLQISGGKYDFSPETKKITDLRIDNIPVDSTKIYIVLMSSFLADGGDGFPVKQAVKISDLSIREMMIQAMKQTDGTVKLFENRIKKVK